MVDVFFLFRSVLVFKQEKLMTKKSLLNSVRNVLIGSPSPDFFDLYRDKVITDIEADSSNQLEKDLKQDLVNITEIFSDAVFRPLVLGVISGAAYTADINSLALVTGGLGLSALSCNLLKAIFPEKYEEALKKVKNNIKDL